MARKNIETLKTILLGKSAKTCNVCRNYKKGVIVHHIDENKMNNNENNLILICTDCHGEAHTKRKLSLNLTPNRLKKMKKEWEKEVENRTNLSINEYKKLEQKEREKEKLSEEERYIQEVREEFNKLDNTIQYTLDISKKLQ